eukprot:67427_1
MEFMGHVCIFLGFDESRENMSVLSWTFYTFHQWYIYCGLTGQQLFGEITIGPILEHEMFYFNKLRADASNFLRKGGIFIRYNDLNVDHLYNLFVKWYKENAELSKKMIRQKLAAKYDVDYDKVKQDSKN